MFVSLKRLSFGHTLLYVKVITEDVIIIITIMILIIIIPFKRGKMLYAPSEETVCPLVCGKMCIRDRSYIHGINFEILRIYFLIHLNV